MRNYKLNACTIKSAINPSVFYNHELANAPLKKAGWNEGGLCPFHADKNTGSFFVNLTTGGFNCFSCGATGGDIISFTMAKYNLGFVEALKILANEWGVL